jgi:hypothetical protein
MLKNFNKNYRNNRNISIFTSKVKYKLSVRVYTDKLKAGIAYCACSNPMDRSVLLFATVGRSVILFASTGSTTMGSSMLFCVSMGSTTMGSQMLFCASMGSTTMGNQMLFCALMGSTTMGRS